MRKPATKLLICLSLITNIVMAGNSVGNGGHPYAAEMQTRIFDMLEEMDTCNTWNEGFLIENEIREVEFKTAAKLMQIEVIKKSKKMKNINGKIMTTITDTANRLIKINRNDWSALRDFEASKDLITLNAYILTQSSDRDAMRISNDILVSLNNCIK